MKIGKSSAFMSSSPTACCDDDEELESSLAQCVSCSQSTSQSVVTNCGTVKFLQTYSDVCINISSLNLVRIKFLLDFYDI